MVVGVTRVQDLQLCSLHCAWRVIGTSSCSTNKPLMGKVVDEPKNKAYVDPTLRQHDVKSKYSTLAPTVCQPALAVGKGQRPRYKTHRRPALPTHYAECSHHLCPQAAGHRAVRLAPTCRQSSAGPAAPSACSLLAATQALWPRRLAALIPSMPPSPPLPS